MNAPYVLSVAAFGVVCVAASYLSLGPKLAEPVAAGAEATTMAISTRSWGRLAQFPATAQSLSIREDEYTTNRILRGSFFDTPENVRRWLESSPGVLEGTQDGVSRYRLKTRLGVAFGEIMVLPGTVNKVVFRVSWS